MNTEIDYAALADIITQETINSQLDEYLLLQQRYSAAIHEVKTKLEILNDEFHIKHDHNPIHSIQSRVKSIRSIAKKLRKNGFEISFASACQNLFDIAGIRVICNYIDDIYAVAEMLTEQTDVELLRVKDYIQNPKPNGYRSLHLIVSIPVFLSSGPVNLPVEIQIRTVAMDFWASLEHELRYKTDFNIPEKANAELLDCAETIALLDKRMQRLYNEAQENTIE